MRSSFGLRSLLLLVFTSCCVAAQAWGQATCTLSKTNQTITICSPANGATVGTTIHVNAGTTDTLSIQYIELYFQNERYVIQHQNFLDASITVPAGTHENLTVQAHDTGGATFKQTYFINVTGSSYSISPQEPTVSEGATLQFSASSASTWKASCGSIDASGLFTAPLSQPGCTVTGTANDGSGINLSTNVNITSPISITPASASTAAGQKQQFSANVSVTWAASCGSIDSNGLFSAPSTAGSCTITATDASGTPYTAEAMDSITSSAPSTLSYTTWKNDNARDGLQSKETILTPLNVKTATFGEIFSTALDDRVWAQPLYVSGVTIGSSKHNVLYVATAHDSVYAIDGDSGAQLWRKSLLGSGEAPADGKTIQSSVQKDVGIVGTPVIDTSSGTIYAVALSVTSAGKYFHRLHALSISSGAEKFGGPVEITTTGWSPPRELQRPGLLLANGNVYIAFGANEDITPYHGYIFSYTASTLHLATVWNATAGASSGGIWMGASGIPADSKGRLFFTTGNGDWNGSTELGQSAVELDASLAVLDYFTPIAHNSESKDDKDLGSGGVLLLPTMNNAPSPNEAVTCSKLNSIYVLDRDNLGQIGSTKDDVVQQVDGQLGGTSGVQAGDRCFSTPAYWNNNLYFIGNNDVLKQFTFSASTGLMSTTPVHKGTYAYQFPGGQPVVSSNGNSNAIVWAIDWKTGTLRAYDATDVSKSLYTSPALGTGIKFTVPTVVNGHVYVGLSNKVVGLGLKGGGGGGSCSPPASPGAKICTPAAGQSYTSPVSVTAAGTPASGTINHMELWIDGKKINDYSGNTIKTSVSVAAGSHKITAVEVDSKGAVLKSTPVSFTVN